MSFDSIETSEYFEPRELYTFTRGTKDWLYTSGDTDIAYGARTFLAEPIKRSKIQSTQDIGQSKLKITTSRSNDFISNFLTDVPTVVISITVTRIHASDDDPAVIFQGRVLNVAHEENEAVITCQQNISLLKNPGLRRLYQTTCPHVLYGGYCGVIKSTYSIEATLDSIDGTTLTSTGFIVSINAEYDDDWLRGGIIEFVNNGVTDKRFITDHTNSSGTIVLNLSLQDAAVGSTVTVYPGCNRDATTCSGKFSNIENYGGFPYIPSKNPMDGTSIF